MDIAAHIIIAGAYVLGAIGHTILAAHLCGWV